MYNILRPRDIPRLEFYVLHGTNSVVSKEQSTRVLRAIYQTPMRTPDGHFNRTYNICQSISVVFIIVFLENRERSDCFTSLKINRNPVGYGF